MYEATVEIIFEAAVKAGLKLLQNMIQWANESDVESFKKQDRRAVEAKKELLRHQTRTKLGLSHGTPLLSDDDFGTQWQNLIEALREKTEHTFMDTYEYVYDDAGTRPPDALPNRKVMSLREFVCCPANKETLIEEYIAKNILINPMPDAVIPKARKALVDAIKPWLRDVRPGFQAHQFQHIYNDEGSDPVQIDAIIYWTNTDAPDATGKNLQPTLFLYYAGVYYRSQLFQPHPVHGSLMPRGAFPVMRVAFAVSSVVISTAIAAWIYEKKPDNLELLINILNGTFKLVIHAPGVPPSHLLKEGSIDLKWLDKALQIAGIDKHEESTGVATQQELNEFAQLDAWKMSE